VNYVSFDLVLKTYKKKLHFCVYQQYLFGYLKKKPRPKHLKAGLPQNNKKTTKNVSLLGYR